MSKCEWCGLESGPIVRCPGGYVASKEYHHDCYWYGEQLDREAIGWLPTGPHHLLPMDISRCTDEEDCTSDLHYKTCPKDPGEYL